MMTGPDRNPLIDEQLSAWLDDELPAEELDLLSARLEASPERRVRLARFSLIGSHLRDRQAGRLHSGLLALRVSARVSAALQASPDRAAGAAPGAVSASTSRFLPYALAAGVAVAAVGLAMLLREAGVGPGLSPDEQTQAFVQLAAPVDRQAAPPETTGARATLSPQRLTSYLVYHGEYSGLLSARVTESHIVNQPRFVGAVQAVDRLPSQ
jgi:negative regulator of sigma E activity